MLFLCLISAYIGGGIGFAVLDVKTYGNLIDNDIYQSRMLGVVAFDILLWPFFALRWVLNWLYVKLMLWFWKQ